MAVATVVLHHQMGEPTLARTGERNAGCCDRCHVCRRDQMGKCNPFDIGFFRLLTRE